MSRRPPLLPTLMTFIIVTSCVALGIWQLQRRQWKHTLVASASGAATLPPVEATDYYRAFLGEQSIQFRRAELPCRPGKVLPYDLKGGASRSGQPGYWVLVSCRPNNRPPDIVAVAGWTNRPDAARVPIVVDTDFTGIILERPYGRTATARPAFLLVPDSAVPPLQPPRQPAPADLPDNHLNYAFQWFAFATTALIIYALWLRRRV